MPAAPSLQTTLATTLPLLDQFAASLSTPSHTSADSVPKPDSPSALPLLSTSSTALRAQSTKLSLLAINTPFTPSALVSVLSAVNESVLPSLVTATLLTTPHNSTQTFSTECHILTRTTLRDFKTLVEAIAQREKTATRNLKEAEKKHITETTGRIWDGCDNLIALSRDGVAGLIVKKAKEYQALIQDAISELEEWDPEEDDDDIFGEADTPPPRSSDPPVPNPSASSDPSSVDLQSQKSATLALFKRVPQTLHVLLKYSPFPPSYRSNTNFAPTQLSTLDRLVACIETTSEAVDEAVGALYEHDVFAARNWGDKARCRMVESVECCLADCWEEGEGAVEGREGKREKAERFLRRARDWIGETGTTEKATAEGGPVTMGKDGVNGTQKKT